MVKDDRQLKDVQARTAGAVWIDAPTSISGLSEKGVRIRIGDPLSTGD
jgi:hypothetical protein